MQKKSINELRMKIDNIHEELNMLHSPSCMGYTPLHMVGYTLDMMEEPHVGIEHGNFFCLQVLKKRNDIENFGQALFFKDEEENLAMGEIAKDIPFKSARKCIHLSMDWVYENITEMEVQGCTRLS